MKHIELFLFSLPLCVFSFPFEHQEKRILFPRVSRHACAWKWANPKQGTMISIRSFWTDEMKAPSEAAIFLLGEIHDSAASLPPSDTGGIWTLNSNSCRKYGNPLELKINMQLWFWQALQGNAKGLNWVALSHEPIPRQMEQNTSAVLWPQTAQEGVGAEGGAAIASGGERCWGIV